MSDEERHELILAEINVHQYDYNSDWTQDERDKALGAAYKQALVDLFRHAANRLEKAEFFHFDFEFLNEMAIAWLKYKWDYKFQITLRNLKPSPSTEAPK